MLTRAGRPARVEDEPLTDPARAMTASAAMPLTLPVEVDVPAVRPACSPAPRTAPDVEDDPAVLPPCCPVPVAWPEVVDEPLTAPAAAFGGVPRRSRSRLIG